MFGISRKEIEKKNGKHLYGIINYQLTLSIWCVIPSPAFFFHN